jgi:protocatechuate 3,4-dioxygenase beta subunit
MGGRLQGEQDVDRNSAPPRRIRALLALCLLAAAALLVLYLRRCNNAPQGDDIAGRRPGAPTRVESAAPKEVAPVAKDADPGLAGTVPAEPPSRLIVRVEGLSGAPILDAEVMARRDGEEAPAVAAANLGDGTYALEGLSSGRYEVRAAAPRHSAWKEVVQVPDRKGVTIRLHDGVTLTGKVLSGEGNPIPGAEVVCERGFRPDFRSEVWRTTTDGSGAFVLEGVAGDAWIHWLPSLEVRASAEGFCTATQSVPSEAGPVEFRLLPEARARGRVVFRDPEEPAPGVEMVVWEGDIFGITIGGGTTGRGATTGDDGRFDLRGLRGGKYTLEARHPEGCMVGENVPFEVEEGGILDGLEIALARGVSQGFRVSDAASGAGIAGAEVVVAVPEEVDLHGLERRGRTDGEGRCRISGLRPDRCDVSVSARGYIGDRFPVQVSGGSGGGETIILRLEKGASISGRVVDPDGLAIAGAEVRIEAPKDPPEPAPDGIPGEPLHSDAAGRYAIVGLPAFGLYVLSASAEGYLPASAEGIAVKLGEARSLDFTLSRGATVSGRVLDSQGASIPGAEVWARGSSGGTSDAAGRYEIRGLQGGANEITATCRGRIRPPPRGIDIRDGETVEGFDIVFPAGGTIQGQVFDETGEPVRSAEIEIHGGNRELRLVSDAEGGFSLQGVPPGQYSLAASKPPSFVGRSVLAVVPGPPVRVKLDRLARVHGIVHLPDGKPARDYCVQHAFWRPGFGWAYEQNGSGQKQSHIVVHPTGHFDLRVPPGRNAMMFRTTGYRDAFAPERRDVVLAPGEVQEWTVRLRPNAGLACRVVESGTGAPVGGAEVKIETPEGRSLEGFLHWLVPTEVAFGLKGYEAGAEGAIACDDLPAGDLVVTAEHPRHGRARVPIVTAPGEVLEVTVELPGGRGIFGRICILGFPAGGARVSVRSAAGPEAAEAVTDVDGYFSFAGLPPGPYEVTASDGRGRQTREPAVVPPEGWCELDLDPTSVRVTGTISTGAGPIGGIEVLWYPQFDCHLPSMPVFTDAGGRYSLRVPAPGPQTLWIKIGKGEGAIHRTEVVPIPEDAGEWRHDIRLEGL